MHCNLPTGYSRALDSFNDQTTKFLELCDARFFRRSESEPLAESPKVVLIKDNVHVAILLGEDRSTERTLFFASRSTNAVPALVTLPNVIVRGLIHMKSAKDVPGFFSFDAGTFFPITNATVLGHCSVAQPIEHAVAMVRKDAVSSIALLPA